MSGTGSNAPAGNRRPATNYGAWFELVLHVAEHTAERVDQAETDVPTVDLAARLAPYSCGRGERSPGAPPPAGTKP